MSKPIAITRDSTISDCIKKIIDYKISHVIAKQGTKPVGIVSEKDLGAFLYKNQRPSGLERIPLAEILNKLVFSKGTTPIKKCARQMVEKKMGSVVIGNEDKLEGIITKTDIVRYFAEHYSTKTKVAEVETPDYMWASAEDPLSEIIKKMLKYKISRIFVKNQNKEPVGIVSFRDLLAISLQIGSEEDVTEPSALSGRTRRGFLSESGFGGVSIARDVMTPLIISVKADDRLSDACKLMLDNKISGLAVVGKDGKTGVISTTDIVRFLASD